MIMYRKAMLSKTNKKKITPAISSVLVETDCSRQQVLNKSECIASW